MAAQYQRKSFPWLHVEHFFLQSQLSEHQVQLNTERSTHEAERQSLLEQITDKQAHVDAQSQELERLQQQLTANVEQLPAGQHSQRNYPIGQFLAY